jgi:hypothetical protein
MNTHLLGKVRDAVNGGEDSWACQSTGERVAVALVLNRADWLASMRYTIPEALDRIGPEWCADLRAIERTIRDEGYTPPGI